MGKLDIRKEIYDQITNSERIWQEIQKSRKQQEEKAGLAGAKDAKESNKKSGRYIFLND